jgi:hypothetical protein
MSLKLKQLGVCLAAVLALSLLASSMASAAKFTSSSYAANFVGEGLKGNWKFNTEVGSSECKASSSATLSEASSTLTMTSLNLSECITNTNGFGSRATTTNMEGCDTLMHIASGSGDTYTGTADIVCPAGASILGYDNEKFCEVRIPAQTGNVTLKYTNNTAEGYVETAVTTSNITYNVVKDSSFCPYSGTGVKTGATITQTQPGYLKVSGKTIVID